MTSLRTSFTSFIVFMINETKESYVWAFNQLKDYGIDPHVILHDRDSALMYALAIVFPKCRSMLCRWHIAQKVLANCRCYFKTMEEFKTFLNEEWWPLVTSENAVRFQQLWGEMQLKYNIAMVAYLEKEWISLKDRFVTAFTSDIQHYGHHDTSRAEGMHNVVKGYILTSTGDLLKVTINILSI